MLKKFKFKLIKLKKCISEKEIKLNPKNNYIFPKSCQIPNLNNIYKQYFGFTKNGTFIEFGAYDGEKNSNTSGLADVGWNGYYLEPVPEFFQKCKKRHKKNKNIKTHNIAIGNEEKNILINIGGALSTSSNKMKEHFNKMEWSKKAHYIEKKIKAKQTTLNKFLKENNIKKNFELLIIDIEGQEWDAIKNFEIKYWQPKMIIIELHDQNDNYKIIRDECNKIVNYFDENNYKIIFKDYTNTIYVQKNLFPIK